MEIKYNVTGPDRKRLVQAIAMILESDAKYLGVPSCAYQVDNFTISKDGIPAELGGDLYLINGAMTKLQDAGAFANIKETEETE